MLETVDASVVDWSRAQFALTAMYHWLFVPLTLGLSIVIGVIETLYYKTGDEFYKQTVKFWMKLFAINFAIGVATGLILEFEFGTNWSNYSWLVGDIFGAPLAIEGMLAFFMESTFIAVMFFGWEKVSRGFHLTATWLTAFGAILSSWWILVANAWMQYPVGMTFNPDTVRNEMVDFMAVISSPVAINKFFHTVLSGFVLGAIFVIGVSAWFLLKKRHHRFARVSCKVSALFGLVAALLLAFTGDESGYQIAQTQPMKLAAVEGLYEGRSEAGLIAVGVLNPEKESYKDSVNPFLFKLEIPKALSFLAGRDFKWFVPGVKDVINGGYKNKDGSVALSFETKKERGRRAIAALKEYKLAQKKGLVAVQRDAARRLQKDMPYFGYGYIKSAEDLVPNVSLLFYSFRVMVILGGYFILFFMIVYFFVVHKRKTNTKWLYYLSLLTIPLAYIASQAGWIVSECGRQPWAIKDMLPTHVAISKLEVGSVQTTFYIFLVIFTVMFIAGLGIMIHEIKKGPKIN